MQPQIIFEDRNTIVVDKPWGMVVNRSDSTTKNTLQDWAETKIEMPKPKSVGDSLIDEEFASRGGIVHRLDKDTSGLLVIAKNPHAFGFLKDQFQKRTVHKVYVALVHGVLAPSVGSVTAPISRNPFNRLQYGVFPGGRDAQTDYTVKEEFTFKFAKFSLVEVSPATGRTHQIRVHLKYLGHPIVSDPIYAGRKQYQADLAISPRLFLHAAQLSLRLPLETKTRVFTAPLPSELEAVLRLLKGAN